MWPGRLPYLGVSAGAVLWFIALCLVIVWTRARAVRCYGMERASIERALRWGILATFVGAWAGALLDRLPRLAQGFSMSDLLGSGFSSGPGYFACLVTVLFIFRKNPRDVTYTMEAASVPIAFMIAIGRLGCLANGCCRGLPTNLPFGIHFPDQPPGMALFPVQPLESAYVSVVGLLLLVVEKKFGTCARRRGGALLMPLLIASYGLWRVLSGFLRADRRVLHGLIAPQLWWLLWTLIGIAWLTHTLRTSPKKFSS